MGEAIVGHLVGDYLLQNDWIAREKTRDTPVCLLHAFLWTCSVMLLAGWFNLGTRELWPVWTFYWLLGTHFVIDRYALARRSMVYTGQRDFAEKLGPWSSIVVDNTWHLVTIWLAHRFLVEA